jgi:hypothetical protein
MAIADIAALLTPAIWVDGMREKQATFPSVLNAGIVTRTPLMDGIASGAGTGVNVPFFKDITDQDDEIQVEDTAPVTTNGITRGQQIAPVLNRVCLNAVTALSAQVSGTDPLGEMLDQATERRLKQRNKTLIALLRGLFGTAGAANGAAALSAVRLGGVTEEPFDETGADATSDQLFSPDKFIDMKYLLGELSNDLQSGALIVHPTIAGRLEKLDKDGFKTGKPSDLPFEITTYRGVPLFQSAALVRAGTGDGYVYDSYLIARGRVGYGEKAQSTNIGDVASLVVDGDAAKNNQAVYDRTRFLMLLAGTKWVGTPSGQSATNAELQTTTNWELVYTTAARCGAVAVRTNG